MKIFITNDVTVPFFALTMLSIGTNVRSSGVRAFTRKILLTFEPLVSLVVVVIWLDGVGEQITGRLSRLVLHCTFLISSDLCSNRNASF